jgi:hypothetical protein
MKSIRISALMLVLGISPLCSLYARAQQEVDPDHFDPPLAAQVHGQRSKVHKSNRAAVTRHRANVMLASKSPHNSNHHWQARQPARSGDLLNN